MSAAHVHHNGLPRLPFDDCPSAVAEPHTSRRFSVALSRLEPTLQQVDSERRRPAGACAGRNRVSRIPALRFKHPLLQRRDGEISLVRGIVNEEEPTATDAALPRSSGRPFLQCLDGGDVRFETPLDKFQLRQTQAFPHAPDSGAVARRMRSRRADHSARSGGISM
jgi:hypothetical protein